MRFFIKSFLLAQFLFSFSMAKEQLSLIDSLFHTDSIRHLVKGIAFGTIGLVKGIDTPVRIKSIY